MEFEFRQAEEEGRDVAAYIEKWEEFKERCDIALLRQQAENIMARMAAEVLDTDPNEPSDLPAICAASAETKTPLEWQGSLEELRNRILGVWLGRAAGCLLGKPVEGITREQIQEILESSGNWSLDNYFTAQGVPEKVLQKVGWPDSASGALRENMECMPEDDDMNYPMVNLLVAEKYGPEFTSSDVLREWLLNLPVLQVHTAERVAYFNALRQFVPPHTARYQNPFREWIGAQIRADLLARDGFYG